MAGALPSFPSRCFPASQRLTLIPSLHLFPKCSFYPLYHSHLPFIPFSYRLLHLEESNRLLSLLPLFLLYLVFILLLHLLIRVVVIVLLVVRVLLVILHIDTSDVHHASRPFFVHRPCCLLPWMHVMVIPLRIPPPSLHSFLSISYKNRGYGWKAASMTEMRETGTAGGRERARIGGTDTDIIHHVGGGESRRRKRSAGWYVSRKRSRERRKSGTNREGGRVVVAWVVVGFALPG